MNAYPSFYDTVLVPIFTATDHRRMRDIARDVQINARVWAEEDLALPVAVIEAVEPWISE